MNLAWLLLIPVLITFVIGAFCTYHKPARDHWSYTPVFLTLSLATGWFWCISVRKLEEPSKILLYSMVWDLLMVIAYYAGPVIAQGNRLSWQAWLAALATIGSLAWFKAATES